MTWDEIKKIAREKLLITDADLARIVGEVEIQSFAFALARVLRDRGVLNDSDTELLNAYWDAYTRSLCAVAMLVLVGDDASAKKKAADFWSFVSPRPIVRAELLQQQVERYEKLQQKVKDLEP